MTSRHYDKKAMRRLFEGAEKSMNSILSELSIIIQKAAERQDFAIIPELTAVATTITSYVKGIGDAGDKLGLTENGPETRTFLIRITEGAIRNSYLTITEAIERGWLRPGETIEVKLPSGRTFATLVMEANRLQERGLISEFYADLQVKPGDFIEMTEIRQAYWLLAPVDVQKGGKPVLNGELLNQVYKVGAVQARYRENGVWYHPLNQFPGVLFDASGYALFNTAFEYEACDKVKKGPDPNHIHVRGGISTLPFYIRLDPPPTAMKA